MRILHTADWHIGRTFRGHSTLTAVESVLGEIPTLIRAHDVDVLIVAGDVFDSATPSADAFKLLQRTLAAILQTGVKVVAISGNHDSPVRLGYNAEFAASGGLHIVTDPNTVGVPVTLHDEHGEVDFYCIPYLDPALTRNVWTGETIRSQADALTLATARIREHAQARGRRTVIVAHTFAAGAEAESSPDSERPITVGTVDAVPVSTFTGFDYVALGHIHGRATLSDRVRYSGAVLHYSFAEAGKPRGGWLVELDGAGFSAAEWVELPVPRPLITLSGTLEALLNDPGYERYQDHWVRAILTDPTRPVEPMRRLQSRFNWCAQVEHAPPPRVGDANLTFADRVKATQNDEDLLEAFLTHVRAGHGLTDVERKLFREVIEQRDMEAATR